MAWRVNDEILARPRDLRRADFQAVSIQCNTAHHWCAHFISGPDHRYAGP
jgi:hypothetical protein